MRLGYLVTSDKSINIFIKNLEKPNKFTPIELDDTNLFVYKEEDVNFIRDEVYEMQDKNAYEKQEQK